MSGIGILLVRDQDAIIARATHPGRAQESLDPSGSGHFSSSSRTSILAGRCFYDDSLDPFDLVRDYGERYYGRQDGPLLARYFEEWARDPELAYRIRGAPRDRIGRPWAVSAAS